MAREPIICVVCGAAALYEVWYRHYRCNLTCDAHLMITLDTTPHVFAYSRLPNIKVVHGVTVAKLIDNEWVYVG